MNQIETEVNNFLRRFHSSNNIDTVFTNGCCYWFAWILYTRFMADGTVLMYDQIHNHFGVMIYDRVYDITGDVTERYQWTQWNELDDESLRQKLIRDCIMF